jgi:hypothetical protein
MTYQIQDNSGLTLAPELVDELICAQLNKPKTDSFVFSWDEYIVKPWLDGNSSWELIKDYWCDCDSVQQEAADDCIFYNTVIAPVINVFKQFQWRIQSS